MVQVASKAAGQRQSSTSAALAEDPEKERKSKRGSEEIATRPGAKKEATQISTRQSGPVGDQAISEIH